jgi:glycosyltransferase involved in cell wall biosynthesis
MLSSFSPVRILHTEPDTQCSKTDIIESTIDAGLQNVETTHIPAPETSRTKISRLIHYYRNDVPRSTRESLSHHLSDIKGLQVESLDLAFLSKSFVDKRIPIILDEHNVYWNMLKYGIFDSPFFRGAIGRTSVAKGTLGPWLLNRAKRFEIGTIENADHVLATSDVDAENIAEEIPSARDKMTVIPNCVDVQSYTLGRESSGDVGSRRVVFVGRLDYEANLDAVRTICRDLAPNFDMTVRFQIVGGPVPSMIRCPGNVEFLGIVPDIRPILEQADVCIAPLRFGSGTRIKIIEYLAMGKPVVTTPIGCEGLEVENERNIMVVGDFHDQARQIENILEDGRLAADLGREARKLAEEKYDWRVYTSRLRSVYESVGAI